jgi:lipopolysaccharide biosynthesis regulator YciM
MTLIVISIISRPLWQFLLQQGSYFYAEQLWEIAVSVSKKWEEQQNQNRKIHKGAGYYFWAATCILKEDLEKGFLLMHEALEEDRKNVNRINIQSTPAYSFVILDYEQQNQFFRKKVLEMAKFIEQKLNNYQTSRNGKLTMAEFKVKFLQNPGLIELVFLFVLNYFMLKNSCQKIKD